jgi:hypothetical protein
MVDRIPDVYQFHESECGDCFMCDDREFQEIAPFVGVCSKLYRKVKARDPPFSGGLCFVAWVVDALCLAVVIAVCLATIPAWLVLYSVAMVVYYVFKGMELGAYYVCEGVMRGAYPAP